MSKTATREYILRKQEDYIGELDRRRRGRILDEVCGTTGLERKYASRLLRGTRCYRRRRGRGKAHGAESTVLPAGRQDSQRGGLERRGCGGGKARRGRIIKRGFLSMH